MIKTFRKLIRRKDKKYYEASDKLSNKEKRKLIVFSAIVLTPFIIAFSIILIN